MNEVSLKVWAEINLTEDRDSVKRAIENIFGILEFEEAQCEARLLVAQAGNAKSLSKFANLLHRERIRDAARSVLFQGLKGNIITFHLNKQVAFAGHVSFCEPVAESPLGPIKIQIKSDEPMKLVDWLAPRTV